MKENNNFKPQFKYRPAGIITDHKEKISLFQDVGPFGYVSLQLLASFILKEGRDLTFGKKL